MGVAAASAASGSAAAAGPAAAAGTAGAAASAAAAIASAAAMEGLEVDDIEATNFVQFIPGCPQQKSHCAGYQRLACVVMQS